MGWRTSAWHTWITLEWKEHMIYLGHVLQALQQANLTIKASKCQVGQSKAVFHGHEVGGGKIKPLRSKVQAVQNWATPTTQTQVRAFLGLTGYYKNFIEKYGTIAYFLITVSSPKYPKKVKWNENCEKAFQGLKDALCKAPVLTARDYNQAFFVQTDASTQG
ncbi:uncharacterized protein [Ambystoma mexicanum]|uniref:uncharacterized protein n=1 Tax=Ambystoma mexicanum TaxID=8296 RepID=UPI0037E714D2